MLERLGQYKILDTIGTGGIGEVYRARDTAAGRTVLLKVLHPRLTGTPEVFQRFVADARRAAMLSHPGIAALEVVDRESPPYLVCEYAPGETLASMMAGQPVHTRLAIDVAAQVADALAVAHAQGVVYEDLKPENVVLTPKGTVKLLDVGLAAWTSGRAEREQAVKAATAGDGRGMRRSAAYMSPEQALGERVDHRSDVFSLGSLLYEMLTGATPFGTTLPAEMPVRIAHAPAPSPHTVNPSVPAAVDPIVRKMLAKSLDARYDSMAAVAADLRTVGAALEAKSDQADRGDDPVVARTTGRSVLGWVAAVAVLAVMAALVWMASQVQ